MGILSGRRNVNDNVHDQKNGSGRDATAATTAETGLALSAAGAVTDLDVVNGRGLQTRETQS